MRDDDDGVSVAAKFLALGAIVLGFISVTVSLGIIVHLAIKALAE